jgi:hypothetical protein
LTSEPVSKSTQESGTASQASEERETTTGMWDGSAAIRPFTGSLMRVQLPSLL